MTENNTGQPRTPSKAHKLLDVFVGKWSTRGQTKATPSEPAIDIIGTDTYKWLPGEFFMFHEVDVRMGDNEANAIEIIGYEPLSQTYPTQFFDNLGNTGTFEASVRDGVWTFAAESERAEVVISEDSNTMTINWERTTDGSNWLPWMDLELIRIRD
ncbi:MAG: DUF1579 family protein [Desulforhopalus sp.]